MVVSGSGFCNGGFFFFFTLGMDYGVEPFFCYLIEYLVTIIEFTELSLTIIPVYNNNLVLLTLDVGCHI